MFFDQELLDQDLKLDIISEAEYERCGIKCYQPTSGDQESI